MSAVTPPESLDVDEPAAAPAKARRRIRSWTIAVAAGVVLALLAGGVAVMASSGTSERNRPVNVKARDAAVLIILKHRARAVLAHDQRAWLADLDPDAGPFQDEQRTVFANLKQLDFASWRYEVSSSEFNAPAMAGRYDTPYILKPLVLHYAIKGYDPGPVARAEVLTFVRRDDRWYLASDTDADADLPVSGHADPWDRRAMVSAEGKHVLVLADAQDKDRLGALVRVGDAAVERVARMWPEGWSRKVVIVAVRDPRLIETYFRTQLQDVNDVAAIAAPSYDSVTGWTPEHSTTYDDRAGAAPRSRVILNPSYFDPDSKDNADILTHEVTHVATQGMTGGGAPTWLVEGAAEYTAYRVGWPLNFDLPDALVDQVAEGSVYLPTYDFFQNDIPAAYAAGLLACGYIASYYGEATLRRYYRQLASTPLDTQTGDRTQSVTRKVLGLSTEQLQSKVATYATLID